MVEHPSTNGTNSESGSPETIDGGRWICLAQRLGKEFNAPFGILDPNGPTWLAVIGAEESSFPVPEVAISTLPDHGRCGRSFLWKDEDGPIWLGLPVEEESETSIWGWAGFARSPNEQTEWGPCSPEPALRAWGQVVADRLHAESRARLILAPRSTQVDRARRSSSLLDELIRRMKVSDPPQRFQLGATRALREELRAAAVAWVPASTRESVIVGGAVSDLQGDQYREIVPPGRDQPVWLLDQVGPAGPRRLAVIADSAENPSGWLVVVDLTDDRLFGTAEIELIRSVASLLLTQRANAQLYAELKDLLFGVIRALVSAIDAKDPYTAGHSERVARIAVRLGEQMGLSPSERSDLYLMGLLHDIGKIGIEDSVLKKPGGLTPDEYQQIRGHVKIGVHILADLKRLHYVLPGVLHHHESFDGTGYPYGLASEAIPNAARILAVADSYDAMSSNRPYRRRLPPEKIESIFHAGSGRQWDPKVVDALFACQSHVEAIRSRGIGTSLILAVDDVMVRSPAPGLAAS